MKSKARICIAAALAVPATLASIIGLRADESPAARRPAPAPAAKAEAEAAPTPATAPTMGTAVKPKELTENVKRGLAYLAGKQNADGGWGQGEESEAMRAGTAAGIADKSNVADTCMAALALIRSGSTPRDGEYAKNILKAVEFVCGSVEKSDKESLWVTDVKGTRVQGKIGQYIDTFTASLLLSEVKGKMPDDKTEKRAHQALGKVVGKMERNQKDNGRFSDDGWAAVVGQGLAAKGLNRAAQAGATVAPGVLAKLEENAKGQFDAKGDAKAGNDAGVKLYASANNTSQLRDAINTLKQTEEKDKATVNSPSAAPKEREAAQDRLRRGDELAKTEQAAVGAVVKNLEDPRFIAGFGNNGGEEFLSYMNISESLAAKGGKEWEEWDKKITDNLTRVQNKDGSWTGHHCITGRTFCTSSALLVLLADRAPMPVAAKLK